MAYVIPNAGPIAAQIAGGRSEMDATANRVLASVRAVASQHVNTGAYISKLSVIKAPSRLPSRVGYVDDRLIVSDDPASMSIEYGHMTRFKNARRVRWVPGLHIMERGLAAVR